MKDRFEVICEIDPPTKPDISSVAPQVEALGPVATGFLVPDNHLGQATVSSIAVAGEVRRLGGRAIVCLNSRDRNLLGLRRDILTVCAAGLNELLFVYGDAPTAGERVGGLRVREMVEEARLMESQAGFAAAGAAPLRLGMTAGLRPLPGWKQSADFLVTQVSFSLDELCAWRQSASVTAPVYAGVLTLASEGMAKRLLSSVSDMAIPSDLVTMLASDRSAGVKAACELVLGLRESKLFDGVHLVPVGRYRQVAATLSGML